MNLDNILVDRIKKHALKKAEIDGVLKSNLYLDEIPKKHGEIIFAGTRKINIEQESIMVFVDDDPLYNWGHPCRYFFYHKITGELIKEVDARFPPYMFQIPPTYYPFSKTITRSRYASYPDVYSLEQNNNMQPANNKYAVLFSGASEYCHVNDLQYLYVLLTGFFNYPKENVYVLNYDGTWQYSSPNTLTDIIPILDLKYFPPLNAAGTKSELDNVFDQLKERLTENDTLFIHTNNHGDVYQNGNGENESCLCLYTPQQGTLDLYHASDFADKLAELPKFKDLIVMMEQCYSGGFGPPILKNSTAFKTCFVSACAADKTSLAGADYDPFTHQWTNTAAGINPGLLSDDGKLQQIKNFPESAAKAYDKAKDLKNIREDSPLLGDNPSGCGVKMYLGTPTLY